MKRYYFELLDAKYNDLGAFIPDGSSKTTAVNKAKKWMEGNGVHTAILSVNSMLSGNLLDTIEIDINK